MTATQISRDTAFLVAHPIFETVRRVSEDLVIARMNEIEASGKFDKNADSLRRSRQGDVGGAAMMVQVATLGSDTLLIFWSLASGKQRRILVDSRERLIMDTERGSIRISENNKYFGPCWSILAARAN